MKKYWLSGRDGNRTCSILFSDSDLLGTHNWMPRTSMVGHPNIRPSQIDAFLRAVTLIAHNWRPQGGEEGPGGVDARKEAAAMLEAAGWQVEMGEDDDSLPPKEARVNIRMPSDLWIWAQQQPKGGSELVRDLLQQERARQESSK